MPSENWFTPEYAANMAANRKDIVEIHTLEFNHPAFIEDSVQVPIRVVGDLVDRTCTLEAAAPFNPNEAVVFTAIPFGYDAPDQTDGAAQQARIRVDNVGREIAQYLDDATETNSEIQVIYRRYLSDDLTTIASGPFYLSLSEILETAATIEGTLSAFRPELQKVIRQVYDLQNYPGLLAVS